MARRTKMNSITSPELLAQVNPENKRLLDDFINCKRSENLSEATLKGYRNDIEIAWVWCLEHNNNKFFIDWKKRDIISFQGWLINENGNSASRVKRIKAALSSMSDIIEDIFGEDYPEFRNIVSKIKNPVGQPVREKTVWKEEELEELLNKLVEKKYYEKACYLALGMCSGRRKAELCRFKVSDFSPENLVIDGALYKSAPIQTKGRGGGKFINCYTLAKNFDPYLDLWMKDRKEKGIESIWLFPNPSDPTQHVGVSTVNSWVNTFERLSGKNAYIHSLRHYFTTMMARAGVPDAAIQGIISWESSDMVRLYDDTPTEDKIAACFVNGEIAPPKPRGFSEI